MRCRVKGMCVHTDMRTTNAVGTSTTAGYRAQSMLFSHCKYGASETCLNICRGTSQCLLCLAIFAMPVITGLIIIVIILAMINHILYFSSIADMITTCHDYS